MSHSFHVVISYFQQQEASLQWEQFYLSPLVGADVAQGCSSPRAEEQGPVRPPAPPHLCHQALEQGCDHSSAAGPALPTIALQTAVVATDDDVSVWNEELKNPKIKIIFFLDTQIKRIPKNPKNEVY